MNLNTVNIVGELVNKFTSAKENRGENDALLTKEILSKNFDCYLAKANSAKAIFNDLIPKITGLFEQFQESNRLTSSGLNVFKMFRPDERMHSYLIAYLLKPQETHGQGKLFLNSFLTRLGIEHSNSDHWVVTAETARIDILLRRATPHSVIVIENKSNFAYDQENQLYRYWYQQIYQPILQKKINPEYLTTPPSKFYQLVYLTPAHWKAPTLNSLSKPNEWGGELPSIVPMQPKQIEFKHFVSEWLLDCINHIPIENYRLKTFIQQYVEFWT